MIRYIAAQSQNWILSASRQPWMLLLTRGGFNRGHVHLLLLIICSVNNGHLPLLSPSCSHWHLWASSDCRVSALQTYWSRNHSACPCMCVSVCCMHMGTLTESHDQNLNIRFSLDLATSDSPKHLAHTNSTQDTSWQEEGISTFCTLQRTKARPWEVKYLCLSLCKWQDLGFEQREYDPKTGVPKHCILLPPW